MAWKTVYETGWNQQRRNSEEKSETKTVGHAFDFEIIAA